MIMNWWEMVELIASICTCLSLVGGMITYFSSTQREKMLRTNEAIDDLYAKHDELVKKNIKSDYMDFVIFTRNVDRFAKAYNAKRYSKRIVKKHAGAFLVRLYDEKLNGIISQQRKQYQRDTYFAQVEEMVGDLRMPESCQK